MISYLAVAQSVGHFPFFWALVLDEVLQRKHHPLYFMSSFMSEIPSDKPSPYFTCLGIQRLKYLQYLDPMDCP